MIGAEHSTFDNHQNFQSLMLVHPVLFEQLSHSEYLTLVIHKIFDAII